MPISEDLKSHFLNLYALALSDNHLDTSELEVLFHIGDEHGVGKKEIEQLILNPDKVTFSIPYDTISKVAHLYDFVQIILADGIVDEREIATLEKFCEKFGFEMENIPKIMEYLIEEGKKKTPKKIILEQVQKTL